MSKNIFTFCMLFLLPLTLLASCSSCQLKKQHMNDQAVNSTVAEADKNTLKSCICPKDFNPVCGSDKMTYSNACSAGCAGVKIVHEGTCVTDTSNP